MTTELERFTEGFRDEHRAARDIMLSMIREFHSGDGARIGELMGQLDAGVGPHMQYEEEEMYPALVEVFGAEYIENMIQDHDRGFGMAGRLMELAGQDPITDEDAQEAERLIRHQLPHVTDCDGLVLAIEVLPEEKQRAIFEARDRALAGGITMTEWGERRGRQPLPPGSDPS